MNKSLGTNLISLSIFLIGFVTPVYSDILKSVGLFSLSGAITNWLAIHMLFEKVPFLYGSGVIPSRFEDFKNGIKELIMNQFFTEKNISNFMQEQKNESVIDSSKIIEQIDTDNIFEELLDVIQKSSFGPMLMMLGGVQALQPLKEPFTERFIQIIKEMIENFSTSDTDNKNNLFSTAGLVQKIESIVDIRLAELTPLMVKEIIQEMIRKHLGWLVVWGGVFGGLIGAIAALI